MSTPRRPAPARAHPGDAQERAQEHGTARRIVEEGVARSRVLGDLVLDAEPVERGVQLRGRPLQGPVGGAVAADDRAGAGESGVEVLRQHPVVDGGRVETARGGHEGEAAAHAEADHADRAGDVLTGEKISPRGLDVLVRPTRPARESPERGGEAFARAALGEEVGHQNDVAGGHEPLHLAAHHLVDSEGLVHDDDRGPRTIALRYPQHAAEAAARPVEVDRNEDVGEALGHV